MTDTEDEADRKRDEEIRLFVQANPWCRHKGRGDRLCARVLNQKRDYSDCVEDTENKE